MGLDICFYKRERSKGIVSDVNEIWENGEDFEYLGSLRKVNILYNFLESRNGIIDGEVVSMITNDDVELLEDYCNTILTKYNNGESYEDYASEVLPYTEGFFFGGNDYGESYIYQIESLQEYLPTLKDVDFGEDYVFVEFNY